MKNMLIKKVEYLVEIVRKGTFLNYSSKEAGPSKANQKKAESPLLFKGSAYDALRRSISKPISSEKQIDLKEPRAQEHKEDSILSQDNEQMQEQLTQQKKIIDIILQTQEQERKRIAEGLHNGLGQLLYAIKLKLESSFPKAAGGNLNKDFAQIHSLLDEAIDQTRTISFELMPAILHDFGLEITLLELCNRIGQGPIKFKAAYSVSQKLNDQLEVAIFRITQELVNNVLKHSRATLAHISISEINNCIVIQVKDNGVGFDITSLSQHKGIGITSIRNRVTLLDGEFYITSTIQTGTEVTIKIPTL